MGKFGFYILGILTGIYLVSNPQKADSPDPLSGLNLFEKPGECLTDKPIKVFEVVTPNTALTNERSAYINGEQDIYYGKIIMVTNDKNELYYNEQIIKPKKCFRHIGMFNFRSKVVPVVRGE